MTHPGRLRGAMSRTPKLVWTDEARAKLIPRSRDALEKKPKLPSIFGPDDDDGTGEDVPPYEVEDYNNPRLDIIELEHTVRIPEARVGRRKTTMGPRLHLPSLRKLVLPQKLFVKKSPNKPGGTILIDASGSMGSWDNIKKWCEEAPYGTIAYYAGRMGKGQLYIYARKGFRAAEIVHTEGRDNVVDGPAMDWLMTQPRPRVMVTDRGFCSASDSLAQIARLGVLERQKQIEVRNYK